MIKLSYTKINHCSKPFALPHSYKVDKRSNRAPSGWMWRMEGRRKRAKDKPQLAYNIYSTNCFPIMYYFPFCPENNHFQSNPFTFFFPSSVLPGDWRWYRTLRGSYFGGERACAVPLVLPPVCRGLFVNLHCESSPSITGKCVYRQLLNNRAW